MFWVLLQQNQNFIIFSFNVAARGHENIINFNDIRKIFLSVNDLVQTVFWRDSFQYLIFLGLKALCSNTSTEDETFDGGICSVSIFHG